MSLYSLTPDEFQDTDHQLAERERRRDWPRLHGEKVKLSEQAINPPHLSYDDYHRNCRNTSREDAIDAIGKLEVSLEDLESGGFGDIMRALGLLRDHLIRDWED
jgi:hypothetical protein